MTAVADLRDWDRLSSRVIWVDLAQTGLALIPAAGAIWLAEAEAVDGTVWTLAILAVVGVLGAAADAIRWVFTRYRITPTHVELRTGVFLRRHRSVRRERIRSVDVEARLRHRLAGLRVVKVGAGQHAATGESALSLDALATGDARALRSALLNSDRAGDEPPDVDQPPPDRDTPLRVFARFRPGWVIYNMFNVWAYVLALGLLWGGYWLLVAFGLDVEGFLVGLLDWERLGWVATAVIAFVAVSAFGAAGLTVNYFTEYWNFELARVRGPEGTQLRTRQGLFTTREVNRDENRIRGVELTEPLVWRWLGVTDTRVITTGIDVWSMTDPAAILPRTPAPFARRTAADVLGVDVELFDAPLQRHPAAALRRRLWWAAASAAGLALLLAVPVSTGLLPPAVLWFPAAYWPLALGGAVIAYRTLGHAIVGPWLIRRSGLVNRSTVVLRRDAVSTIVVRESVLQRRLGLRTVSAMTAAGYGNYQVPDVAAGESTDLARAAAPGLLEPFLTPDRPDTSDTTDQEKAPAMTSPASPTSSHRRLLAPDLARGFMLLLIAMAYASVYIGAEFGVDVSGEPWWDRAATFLSTLLLDNRAFPMFAILFGYGVAWSVRRRSGRGVGEPELRRTLRRRAWLLFLFGAVHAVLVFPGEILTSYGLALLITGWLLFRSDRALRVVLLVTGVFYLVTVPLTMVLFAYGRDLAEISVIPGYTTVEDWITRLIGVPFNPLYLAVAYPLLFLVVLGYLAGRARLLEEPDNHRGLLRRIAVTGITVSLAGALPSALIFIGALDIGWGAEGLLMGLQVLTGVAGGAGYAALFVLLADRMERGWRVGTRAVAAVGKRSLSFYILNSVLVAVVLHPQLIGLDTGAFGALVVAVVAWVVSVGLAGALERAGRPGPLESLMRRGVYGRDG